MPREELPPDKKSLAKWENMPHNSPSKHALPPATGGGRGINRVIILLFILVGIMTILSLLVQRAG